jgi:carbon monoxide dehydrogenase subunit G
MATVFPFNNEGKSMPKLEKTIFIAANVEKVFAFMSEPNNLLEIWPSLLEVTNVQPQPTGGCCYDWVYKMAGRRFKGQTETSEFILNRRMVNRSVDGILGTIIISCQPEDGGTWLNFSVEYSIPEVVLTRISKSIVQQMNETEADSTLANVKTRLEN